MHAGNCVQCVANRLDAWLKRRTDSGRAKVNPNTARIPLGWLDHMWMASVLSLLFRPPGQVRIDGRIYIFGE